MLIAVMLRGRHRGLPVAIDRAVMLPKDFTAAEEQAFEETRSRRLSRRGSMGVSEEFMASLRRGSMSNMSGPVRRDSTPEPTPRSERRGSSPPGTLRSSLTGSQYATPGSPTTSTSGTLQFSLPRTSSDARTRSPIAMRGGTLTPVKESSMSRANTRTDI